jgi:hypothetical protein
MLSATALKHVAMARRTARTGVGMLFMLVAQR